MHSLDGCVRARLPSPPRTATVRPARRRRRPARRRRVRRPRRDGAPVPGAAGGPHHPRNAGWRGDLLAGTPLAGPGVHAPASSSLPNRARHEGAAIGARPGRASRPGPDAPPSRSPSSRSDRTRRAPRPRCARCRSGPRAVRHRARTRAATRAPDRLPRRTSPSTPSGSRSAPASVRPALVRPASIRRAEDGADRPPFARRPRHREHRPAHHRPRSRDAGRRNPDPDPPHHGLAAG